MNVAISPFFTLIQEVNPTIEEEKKRTGRIKW